jgi:hypothetical protein
VIQGLRRPREWYFAPRLDQTLITGLLTFGIWPLARLLHRLERWHRLEWNLLGHAMRELQSQSARRSNPLATDSAGDLIRFVDDCSIRPPRRVAARLGLLAAAVIALHWLVQLSGSNVGMLLHPIWVSLSSDGHRAALAGVLLVSSILTMRELNRHENRVRQLREMLDRWLIDQELRPPDFRGQKRDRPGHRPDPSFIPHVFAGAVSLALGLWWMFPALVGCLAMRRYVSKASRPLRTELARRIIERAGLAAIEVPPDPERDWIRPMPAKGE